MVLKLKYFSLLFVLIFGIYSCNNSENNSFQEIKIVPIATQYPLDIQKIESYLSSHYIDNVSSDFDITFKQILSTDTDKVSIKNQTQYPLLVKEVLIENVLHKIYYLTLRTGTLTSPNNQSSIKCAYKGLTLKDNVFDFKDTYATFPLSRVIRGWQEILPLFKSGNYSENSDSSINTSTDFGSGVMFLPSALAYYNQSPGPSIDPYSPLIFTFKLRNVQ